MKLFSLISEFISPELIFSISTNFEEDHVKVSSAIRATLASILEIIINKKENKKLELLLKHAGTSSILLNSSDLYQEEVSSRNKRIIFKFSQYLLNGKEEEFVTIISLFSGLPKDKTKKIISIVLLLSAAFLGEYLVSGINFSSLKYHLEEEKYDFKKYIPLNIEFIIKKPRFFLIHQIWSTMF